MIQLYYYYTERKIGGHIFVCFIALQMKVLLTQKIEEIGEEEVTYSEVMRDVRKIRAVEILLDDQVIVTRTNPKGKAQIAFKAVDTSLPPKVLEVRNIN